MSDPRHKFEAHRCAAKPDCVSIRRYRVEPGERGTIRDHYRISDQFPGIFNAASGSHWVLASWEHDYDSDWQGLADFGTINYCPYCGARLVRP